MSMGKITTLFTKIKAEADVLFLILIALGVRLFYILKFDFWFDEAFTGILMRVPLNEFLSILKIDTNPPVYYLLLKLWTLIFGTGEIPIRMFSVVAGVLTVYIAYLIGKKFFHKEAGLIAGLIIAFSPFTVQYSIEARSYSLFGLVCILSLLLLLEKKYLYFAFLAALIPFIHYSGMIYLALLAVAFVVAELRSKNFRVILPVTLLFAFCLLFTYNDSKSKANAVTSDWIKKPTIMNIKKSTYAHLFGVTSKKPGSDETISIKGEIDKKYFETFIISLYAALLVLAVVLKKLSKKEGFILLQLALLTLIPMLVAVVLPKWTDYNIYVERYLYPSSIFFLISLGILLRKLMQIEIVFIVLFFYLTTIFTRLDNPKYYSGMRDIVANHAKTVNYITFTSPMDYVIGRYYFGEEYNKLRYFDPKDKEQKYLWWPFMREGDHMAPKKDSLLVVPDENRLDDPTKYSKRRVHKDYIIYSANEFN